MKWLKWFLVLTLFTLPLLGGFGRADAQGASQTLILTKNSKTMLLNGTAYTAAQPFVMKNGVSYAPFSSLAARYGYQVSYDAASKQSIARSAAGEIRFRMNSKEVTAFGTKMTGQANTYSEKGSLMIPIRTWGLATGSRVDCGRDPGQPAMGHEAERGLLRVPGRDLRGRLRDLHRQVQLSGRSADQQ